MALDIFYHKNGKRYIMKYCFLLQCSKTLHQPFSESAADWEGHIVKDDFIGGSIDAFNAVKLHEIGFMDGHEFVAEQFLDFL